MKGVTSNDGRLLALVLLLAVPLYAVTFASCGLIAPKSAINGSVNPPAEGAAAGQLSNYVDNQHVAGVIDPTFIPSVNDKSVTGVTLTVDSEFVEAVTSPPIPSPLIRKAGPMVTTCSNSVSTRRGKLSDYFSFPVRRRGLCTRSRSTLTGPRRPLRKTSA